MSEFRGYEPSEEEIKLAEESMTSEQNWMSMMRERFAELNEMSTEEYRKKSVEMINRILELAPQVAEMYNKKPEYSTTWEYGSAPTGDSYRTANNLARYAREGYQGADDNYKWDPLRYSMDDGYPHGLEITFRKIDPEKGWPTTWTSRHTAQDLVSLMSPEEQKFMELVGIKAQYQHEVRAVKKAKKYLDAFGVDINEIERGK